MEDTGAYEALRRRHVADFEALLPGLVERLAWSAEELHRARLQALRHLVEVAVERSAWHRKRLVGIDPSRLTEADIEDLPVMTKTDLMDNFDEIVTDKRLTREVCEAHLAALTSDAYLLDEFHVVASGGSSGQRGVFVYGWDAWAICYASLIRSQVRDFASDPALVGTARVAAAVAASKPTHISSAFGQTFSSAGYSRQLFPVSRPLQWIVAGLNDLQPTILMGYSSYLPRLVAEAAAGRLRISPRRVIAISEPLLPEVRAAVEQTWGAPVANSYGMSEGVFVGTCRHGGMHLPDDLCLFEPVDAAGRRVGSGVTSHRVFITNLYNPTMPLIRYEVTDEVTLLDPCPCGSPFRRIADPQGRLDDLFVYAGGVVIHPHVFRSVLGRSAEIVEYQVGQTSTGADVRLVTRSDADVPGVGQQLEEALAALGLGDPVVSVTVVDAVDRLPTGKLRRFIPLAAS